MQAKTERFEMRLDADVLERVDLWRARKDSPPSRSEAIRQLIDDELTRSDEVQLGDADRLILMMLRDIAKHLKVKGEIDPDFVAETIWGGHLWGLRWEYPGLLHNDNKRRETVSEVGDILDMWSFMESGYAKLSEADKDLVAKEVGPLGKKVEFRGFDANNESAHYSIALFLTKHLNRYAEFKGRDLSSHFPGLEGYRRMLEKFKPMRPNLGMGRELGAAAIIELLQERLDPSRR